MTLSPQTTLRSTLLAVLALGCLAAPSAAGRKDRLEPADSSHNRQQDLSETEALKHFQYASRFYAQGLLKQAEDSLRLALSQQPHYPEAHYLMGMVALELNNTPRAISEAEMALEQNPFFTEAHNLIGIAHAKTGAFDQALREFSLVLGDASFPTPEVAHFNIGKIAWERQAFGEANLQFRKAIALNPGYGRAWYLLGDCQEQLGLPSDARESYARAVELLPQDVGPLYRLGIVCLQMGDKACAQNSFETVRSTSPASDEALAAREQLRQLNFR